MQNGLSITAADLDGASVTARLTRYAVPDPILTPIDAHPLRAPYLCPRDG